MKITNILLKDTEGKEWHSSIELEKGTIKNVDYHAPFLGKRENANFYVTPGFVNCHLHPNQLFDRRLLDSLSITHLLDQMHLDLKKTSYERYVQALFVLMEAVKSGATSIYSVASHPDPVIDAYLDLDLKGAITCFFSDQWEGFGAAPQLSHIEEIKNQFQSYYQRKTDDLHIHIGTPSIESASNHLLLALHEIATTFDVKINCHVSEGIESVHSCLASRNTTPIRLLEHLGILSERLNLIHGVSIDQKEVELLGRFQTSLIHCPVSNAKTGVGISPIKALMEAGVRIGLGSDACSNNNTNNILSEAYFASLIHAGVARDPSMLPPSTLFKWLTEDAYPILGMTHSGKIKVGEKGDLLFWSLDDSPFTPIAYGNFDAALLYNAPDLKPHTVMINGKTYVENYTFTACPEKMLIENANLSGLRIFETLQERSSTHV